MRNSEFTTPDSPLVAGEGDRFRKRPRQGSIEGAMGALFLTNLKKTEEDRQMRSRLSEQKVFYDLEREDVHMEEEASAYLSGCGVVMPKSAAKTESEKFFSGPPGTKRRRRKKKRNRYKTQRPESVEVEVDQAVDHQAKDGEWQEPISPDTVWGVCDPGGSDDDDTAGNEKSSPHAEPVPTSTDKPAATNKPAVLSFKPVHASGMKIRLRRL